jgi:streptogramin lyase
MKRIGMKVLGLAMAAGWVGLTAQGQAYQSRTVSTFAGTSLCTALDSAGDLYFTAYSSSAGYQIQELVAVNGVIPTGAAPVVITATGITVPVCLTMDKNGNLIVIDNTHGTVLKEILAVNGKLPANPTAITLYTAQSPSQLQSGLAVDGNGNVFFEEYAGTTPEYLEEMVAVAGAVTPASSVVKLYTEPLQGGLSSQAFIQALATDSKNNLYYIHEGNRRDLLRMRQGTSLSRPGRGR